MAVLSQTAFDFHGASVVVHCETEQVHAGLRRRLRHFVSPTASGTAAITFEVVQLNRMCEHNVPDPPAAARAIYESRLGPALFADATDELFLDAGADLKVRVAVPAARIQTSVRGPVDEHLWLLSHPLFTLPLIELLKRRSLFSLHAAGLSLGGDALLLAGTSGSGKSTLAIALLRAGFDFLGDDMLFLTSSSDGIQVLAFPDEIDVTEHTIRLFPELAHVRHAPRAPGWPKWSFLHEAVYPVGTPLQARPKVLIFPHIGSRARSSLTCLSPQQTLVELAPNVLLTETQSSAAHFAALAELARTCPAYRLEAGRDFDAIGDLLRELLVSRAQLKRTGRTM